MNEVTPEEEISRASVEVSEDHAVTVADDEGVLRRGCQAQEFLEELSAEVQVSRGAVNPGRRDVLIGYVRALRVADAPVAASRCVIAVLDDLTSDDQVAKSRHTTTGDRAGEARFR